MPAPLAAAAASIAKHVIAKRAVEAGESTFTKLVAGCTCCALFPFIAIATLFMFAIGAVLAQQALADSCNGDALGGGPAGSVSAVEVAQLAKAAGFSGRNLVIAVAVAKAESGFITTERSLPNTDGSIDRGLWQINSKAHPDVNDACAYDAVCNAQAAFRIANGGTDWAPWTTYTHGAYASNLAMAAKAVQQMNLGASIGGLGGSTGRAVAAHPAPAAGGGGTAGILPGMPPIPSNAETFQGKTSWFTGPMTASGVSAATTPGIALRRPGTAFGDPINEESLKGYFLIKFPNGKSVVLQQIDIGPNQSTGRSVDVSEPAVAVAGYTTSNFPTDATVTATYLGHNPAWAPFANTRVPGGTTATPANCPAGMTGTGTGDTNSILAAAMQLDRMNLPYTWGGGHGGNTATPAPGLDCSGAVSWMLQHAGVKVNSMVSGGFMAWGDPVPGGAGTPHPSGVYLYAGASHIYMTINGKVFSAETASLPDGGPHWRPTQNQTSELESGMVVRHVRGT